MFGGLRKRLSVLALISGLILGSMGAGTPAFGQEPGEAALPAQEQDLAGESEETALTAEEQDLAEESEEAALTAEELAFAKEEGTLKVGFVQDRIPVSFLDDDGELGGISRYIFDRIEVISGLDFEYVALPTGSVTYDYLLNEGFDLITSVEYNKENQAARGILMSDPYLSSQKVIVAREDLNFTFNDRLSVAVSTGSQTLKKVLAEEYPNFEIVDYDSMEQCLDAVNRGEADIMIQNQFMMEYWLFRPAYGNLKIIPIAGIDDMLCFSAVVPLEGTDSDEFREKEKVISIINKSIAQLSDDEIAMFIIEATMENQYNYTAMDFLYQYRYVVFFAGAALILILVLFVQLVRLRMKSMEERADARVKMRFLSTMSHEVRTPLNGLIGLNYLMAQNLRDSGKMAVYLQRSTATARYLLSLLDDILDMSRLQDDDMELEAKPVNLGLLISTVEFIAQSSMENKKIDFRADVNLPYPNVIGDEVRVQQVLLNILDNAGKFTQPGGQVHFTVDQEIRKDGKVVTRFDIADTGCGMSEEFQKHIFDSFTQELDTVSKGNQGTGLGMAISFRLSKLMGGSLNVTSKKGEGSVFTFSFPADILSMDFLDGSEDDEEELHAKTPSGSVYMGSLLNRHGQGGRARHGKKPESDIEEELLAEADRLAEEKEACMERPNEAGQAGGTDDSGESREAGSSDSSGESREADGPDSSEESREADGPDSSGESREAGSSDSFGGSRNADRSGSFGETRKADASDGSGMARQTGVSGSFGETRKADVLDGSDVSRQAGASGGSSGSGEKTASEGEGRNLDPAAFAEEMLGKFHVPGVGPLGERMLDPVSGKEYSHEKHMEAKHKGPVTGSVLIAEDNELNAEILMELLADEGIETDLAENGREAVALFSASEPGKYSIILMDLLMPEMNGFQAAKAIRALDREDAKTVRIFACTANTLQSDREKAIASGMNDFITKPIDIDLLLAKLSEK